MIDERPGGEPRQRVDDLDELLRDLDAALSVEPSPAVAARVRTHVDERAGRPGFGWHLAIASIVVVIAAYGLVYRRDSAQKAGNQDRTVTASREAQNEVVPLRALRDDAADIPVRVPEPTGRPRRPRPEASSPAVRQPEVIVSADVRLAFEQLQSAAWTGRLTAESLPSAQPPFVPTIVVPSTVDVRPVEVEWPPSVLPVSGPVGGADELPTQQEPKWIAAPRWRTRSVS
jgi:hypothetical protein